jgi:hypothetical protein
MNKKITLNIDQKIIENVKKYAKKQKRSISNLIEEYLFSISLSVNNEIEYNELGPITRELIGIIKTNKNTDYKNILTDALMEKYL